MNVPLATTAPLDTTAIQRAVDASLTAFLDDKVRAADPRTRHIPEALRDFVLAGGKRLRPVLCVLGWHAAAGRGDLMPVATAAASLELFHAFALIHDDIMDNSATRRGRPTIHHALTARHRDHPDPRRLGINAAILAGDLALVYSDELLHRAGLSPRQLRAALPVLDVMRSELMHGQYLDLLATGRPTTDIDHALTIARFKTAKYTIERPLHLGAALAGAGPNLYTALTAFALPLGEAFQLRDDLLGVFGDPTLTGKSTLDDLRAGKHTVLTALALHLAPPHDKRRLRRHLGRADLTPDDAAQLQAILTDTTARTTTERMITTRYHQALRALTTAELPPPVTIILRDIALHATTRPR